MKFARLPSPPRRLHQFQRAEFTEFKRRRGGTAGRNFFEESRKTDKDIVGFRSR